jgi:dTDP-4-dehydrorhamnose reductase
MKYAVLGSAGQLGHDLCPRLAGDVVALTRSEVDLTRPDTIRPVLHDIRADIIVNCAAYNLVDRAESDASTAFAVNCWGVRELALACRDLDCVLVHFSTDYVFGLDETRRTPYGEADPPGPVSVYGLSKLAGEYFVRSLCAKHFVIRTCGLYGVWGSGGKGGNFVETMLRLGAERKPIRVVADQICTPSYTVDVATAAAALLKTSRYGLYHITNADSCSWHEFARTIFELADVSANLSPISTQEYTAAARRPRYSVLDMQSYANLGLALPRSWREAVSAYLQERKPRPRRGSEKD